VGTVKEQIDQGSAARGDVKRSLDLDAGLRPARYLEVHAGPIRENDVVAGVCHPQADLSHVPGRKVDQAQGNEGSMQVQKIHRDRIV
jgi:hypothetical protein